MLFCRCCYTVDNAGKRVFHCCLHPPYACEKRQICRSHCELYDVRLSANRIDGYIPIGLNVEVNYAGKDGGCQCIINLDLIDATFS